MTAPGWPYHDRYLNAVALFRLGKVSPPPDELVRGTLGQREIDAACARGERFIAELTP